MSELLKLICSEFAVETLLKYPTVVFEIIPELAAEKGLFQRQDYHCYDVYEHTVRAMGEIAPIEDLRLAMLLHDVGKPACSDGYGHFKGHAKVSAKLTEEILRRFNCSNNRVKNVVCLVGAHSIELKADKTYIKQLMSNYGTDMVKNILAVAKADNSAKRPTAREQKLEVIAGMENILADILKSTPSISLQMLAVSGDEIIASGVQKGPMVGKILNDLLQDVIEENVENTKQSLLEEVEKKLRKNF